MKCVRWPWHSFTEWIPTPLKVDPPPIFSLLSKNAVTSSITTGQVRSCKRCGWEDLRRAGIVLSGAGWGRFTGHEKGTVIGHRIDRLPLTEKEKTPNE